MGEAEILRERERDPDPDPDPDGDGAMVKLRGGRRPDKNTTQHEALKWVPEQERKPFLKWSSFLNKETRLKNLKRSLFIHLNKEN